jgi:serine/threonine protein kinase
MAPEVLFGKKYGHKRDVWALGAMYFQLITGNYIFGDEKCTLNELEDQVIEGKWSFPKNILFSIQGIGFLNQLLAFNED